MATRERRSDRARTRARQALTRIGREIDETRIGSGVSIRDAAAAVGLSPSTQHRIAHGRHPNVTVEQLFLACAAVGLDLVLSAYPAGDAVRDRGQLAALERFRVRLPVGTPVRTEVVLPESGGLRAFDAVITLARVRIAVEVETRLGDVQALVRRLERKRRDGGIELMILVVADTRRNREVLAAHRELLRTAFPLDGRAIWAAIAQGRPPSASGIVFV